MFTSALNSTASTSTAWWMLGWNDPLVSTLAPLENVAWLEYIHSLPLFVYFSQFISFWFQLVFVRPLLIFYLHGPRWGNWGMWGGAAPSDMCAYMTTVDAMHWKQHPDVCIHLIRQRFFSFLLLIYATVYLFVLFKLCYWLFCSCFGCCTSVSWWFVYKQNPYYGPTTTVSSFVSANCYSQSPNRTLSTSQLHQTNETK